MSRSLRPLSDDTIKALYLAAVKEQRIYHHKAYEQSFRHELQLMRAERQRQPRIQYAKSTLGWLSPGRPTELRYLIAAIKEGVKREGAGSLHAICRHCEEHLLPHLITDMPRTARALMDLVRKARKS